MLLALAAMLATPDSLALPEGAALTEAIRARDAELFSVLFERCEPERMRALVTADIEFYHDRDGVVRSAEAFVADYARFCRERQARTPGGRGASSSPPASTSIPSPATARSRMASISSTSAGATGPSISSAAPASPNCGR